jgi:mannosyltransferase OCH1-like enzyme
MNEKYKIIHQIWYDLGNGPNVPDKYTSNIDSIKKNHPDWRYQLWTKNEGDIFMMRHFPQYFSIYENVKYPIMKIDILRCCLLYFYGGMYIDMDYKFYRNIDDYLKNVIQEQPTLEILINETPDSLLTKFMEKKVSNSLIIATIPNSTLLKELINVMFKRIQTETSNFHIQYVMKTTGPGLWNDMISEWNKKANQKIKIHILPNSQFNYCNDCNVCKPSKDKPKYAVHSYDSLWNKAWWLQFRKLYSCYEYPTIAIILILLIFIVRYIIAKLN